MALVTFQNITKEYQGKEILRGVNFQLNPGRKLGLIGSNGTGKTTILRILIGEVKPDAGSVTCAGDLRVGYVPQYIRYEQHQTVLECILSEYNSLAQNLRDKEQLLARHEEKAMHRALQDYQRARDAFDRIGGDSYPARAKSMLSALGLAEKEKQPVSALSGGEQNVLGMARALLEQPNLLILDEPGNHLDFMGVAWLEDFLRRFNGAVLIVSHNRYLLDRVVSGILSLEKGKVRYYNGCYSDYQAARLRELIARQQQYVTNQKRLLRLEALVRRFADIARGHASDPAWGKRLRARRSQLEREKAQAVDKPEIQTHSIKVDFSTDTTRANIALSMKNYRKAYGDNVLLENVCLDIAGGQRWALVGPNGCGKTSMLRDIVEQGSWQNPAIRVGPSFTVGYCAQQQEELHSRHTVLEEIMSLNSGNEKAALNLLARFMFTDQQVHKLISNLSGGERNRLQLTRLMLLKPNLLILDEPTNHLDIATREAVEDALADFEGTLLVVSHDRYFLDKIVDHVAEIRDKKIYSYPGNFTTFWYMRYASRRQDSTVARITTRGRKRRKTKSKNNAKTQKLPQAARRPRKVRNPWKIAELEKRINQLEEKKQQLQDDITTAYGRGDHNRGVNLTAELKPLQQQLEQLYDQWVQMQSGKDD